MRKNGTTSEIVRNINEILQFCSELPPSYGEDNKLILVNLPNSCCLSIHFELWSNVGSAEQGTGVP